MCDPNKRIEIDLVLPIHNEGDSIEATLLEFHHIATRGGVDICFIACEDGSTDDTVAVLEKLTHHLPILLITSPERKGYSRAVVDGLRAANRDFVLFIDSDGQCDPADLVKFTASIATADMVVGYRAPRRDHWARLLMSGLFSVVYRCLFTIPARDPSCPYLLIRKKALDRLLAPTLGILKQGFWWEFLARAYAARLEIKEVPIRHRERAAGQTQVYRPSKIPGIACRHVLGLFRLRKELRGIS
jgi:dolichol-phosphate mannosyltransferase